MTEKHWFRVTILLTIPSLAMNMATLVVVGGLLIDLKKRDDLDPQRFDTQVSDLMISTARKMRQEQADSNAELRQAISEYLERLAKRTEAEARPIR
ncbi:hypothetical protein CWO91_21265 [Bradyrhizobium genosp. SA-3]|uniref:hypothetical protein n=1 Tax=Bradyrhizobium genosp. SA-3 TaxID=508868 RepID=UPI001028A1C3|nr:hypothetical protein [Bradyrhizobium genosp. SA-3]RZN08690.1 hypothetical protein CWO91_21265 [Bradyrhizobium genosp. SA-3]